VYIVGTATPAPSTSPTVPSIITSNSFNNPTNHSANTGSEPSVWNIVVERGSAIIDGNMFMVAGTTAHNSYKDKGGDIWLKTNVDSADGRNYHLQTLTNTNNYIKKDGTPASSPTKIP
jgi:hypothetical protein